MQLFDDGPDDDEGHQPERDHSSELIPLGQYTVKDDIVLLSFAISGSDSVDVRLQVDAAPGCGGIVWPAGQVSPECNRRTL